MTPTKSYLLKDMQCKMDFIRTFLEKARLGFTYIFKTSTCRAHVGPSLGVSIDGCKILYKLSDISIDRSKLTFKSCFQGKSIGALDLSQNQWVPFHHLTHPNENPIMCIYLPYPASLSTSKVSNYKLTFLTKLAGF